MLRFDINRILRARGIDEPYRWLVKNGFVPPTVKAWLDHRVGYIKPDHLERLCLLLNCTPNDLFEWREDSKTVVPEGHALRSLKRETPARSVADMTRDIPADKLEKLSEMLAELQSNHED